MPQAALPYIAVSLAVGSLGYGIYAGQQAQKAQRDAIAQANQNAQNQKNQQDKQYQDQLSQEQKTRADNWATEAATKSATQAAQADALAAEKAAIGTGSQTLSDSLAAQNTHAFANQDPLIEQRLNSLGLLQSGALPAQQAKYQADLQAQADQALAQYQVGAQGQLSQNAYATSVDQVNADRANALLNIQNEQQNMSQNFATTNVNNQNNVAYQQYINSLQMAQAQSQQQSANSYANLGGQIGGGILNYYGNQNQNASLQALMNQNQMYGNVNQFSNSYKPNDNPNINASGTTVGRYMS